MDYLISAIKNIALIELALVTLLTFLFFITRRILHSQEKRKEQINHQIIHTVAQAIAHERLFTTNELNFLEKNNFALLMHLLEIDSLKAFNALRQQLSNDLFKPLARKFSLSKNWLNRYTAVLAYAYGFDTQDEKNLICLIHDPSLLIALNAAKIAINQANSSLINTVIDVFSVGRRLQQSVCSELLSETSFDIGPIISKRLEHEQNIYIKVFCYRLLSKLNKPQFIGTAAQRDIHSESIDLKIAALFFVHSCEDQQKSTLVNSLAQDPSWEVRAIIAKLLRAYGNEQSLHHLELLLHDEQWWVRLNAAHSLVNQGQKGVDILQSQAHHPETYKLAQNILQQQE